MEKISTQGEHNPTWILEMQFVYLFIQETVIVKVGGGGMR